MKHCRLATSRPSSFLAFILHRVMLIAIEMHAFHVLNIFSVSAKDAIHKKSPSLFINPLFPSRNDSKLFVIRWSAIERREMLYLFPIFFPSGLAAARVDAIHKKFLLLLNPLLSSQDRLDAFVINWSAIRWGVVLYLLPISFPSGLAPARVHFSRAGSAQ